MAWLDGSFPEDHPFSQSPIKTIDSKPQLQLLRSSPWSASAAAELGLRYVLAGFINQRGASRIIDSYRTSFKPSDGDSGIKIPEIILAVHAVRADTEEEARRQLAPVHVMYRNLAKGIIDGVLSNPDGAVKELGGLPKLERYISGTRIPPQFIGGTPDSVQQQLKDLAKDFSIEEIMIQDMMTDHQARLRSYGLLAKMI